MVKRLTRSVVLGRWTAIRNLVMVSSEPGERASGEASRRTLQTREPASPASPFQEEACNRCMLSSRSGSPSTELNCDKASSGVGGLWILATPVMRLTTILCVISGEQGQFRNGAEPRVEAIRQFLNRQATSDSEKTARESLVPIQYRDRLRTVE